MQEPTVVPPSPTGTPVAPTATSTTTPVPTATPSPTAVPTATPTPQPTPTPEPTATRVPIPTATPIPTPIPLDGVLSFNELPVRRPFPEQLHDDAPELPADEVIALWEEWFRDARVAWVQGDVTADQFDYYGDLTQNPQYVEWVDSHYCADGTNVGVNDFEFPENIGQRGRHVVSHSPADPWNKISVSFSLLTPEDAPPFFVTSLDVDGEYPWQVFPGPRTWVVAAEPDVDLC